MTERTLKDFDLSQIAKSGQCFRISDLGDGKYALIAFGKYLLIDQHGQTVRFDCGEDEFNAIWRSYFDLDTDYGRYKSAVDTSDDYMKGAIAAGGGIRILRQELWETIVCFIISQRNNMNRIRKCVEKLSSLYGETCYNKRKEVYHLFPTAERLASATVAELEPVRLGYRAKYIIAAAQQASSGMVDLDAVTHMDYENARTELMKLTGVGKKVAECICLFALHHIDAFPIDTHIQQMLDTHYPDGFPMERYKGFAGVMQQYGFYYELGV